MKFCYTEGWVTVPLTWLINYKRTLSQPKAGRGHIQNLLQTSTLKWNGYSAYKDQIQAGLMANTAALLLLWAHYPAQILDESTNLLISWCLHKWHWLVKQTMQKTPLTPVTTWESDSKHKQRTQAVTSFTSRGNTVTSREWHYLKCIHACTCISIWAQSHPVGHHNVHAWSLWWPCASWKQMMFLAARATIAEWWC